MTSQRSNPESVAGTGRDEWTALYDEYSVRVWRYVARIIGSDRNSVADAVQETFLAAVRGFDRFDPNRGTAWAWLSGIAHRQAALHWRNVSRQRLDPNGSPIEETFSLDGEASGRLERIETVLLVRTVLADLSADAAALLTGKYCDDMSVADLVEVLGGTTEGVRSRLARARAEFRRRFEEKSEGRALDHHTLKTLDGAAASERQIG